MPDITKCHGTDCPIKQGCYRFTSKPSQWQSYFTTSPNKGNSCKYTMPRRKV
jgi:hypothetical protein